MKKGSERVSQLEAAGVKSIGALFIGFLICMVEAVNVAVVVLHFSCYWIGSRARFALG